MRSDLEKLWNVEDHRKEDDETFVELDVFLRQNRSFAKLTVKANPDVTLKAKNKCKKNLLDL
jgi:hypothetical protein